MNLNSQDYGQRFAFAKQPECDAGWEATLHVKPRQRFLSSAQVRKLHEATLSLMERTGFKVTHEKAREILHGYGCSVEGNRVRLPGWLVEQALSSVPSQVAFYDRNRTNAVILKEEDTWYGPTLDAFDYLDPVSRERRRFTLEDCRATARLADALHNFTWIMTIGVCDDGPPSLSDRLIAKQALTNCQKPLLFCCNSLAAMKDIYHMAVAIAGDEERLQSRPNILGFEAPISPLTYDDPLIDRLLFAAEKGLPQVCYSGPQAGSTAPATLAGTVVQGSAESLFGIVLAQLVNPGAPFIYGAFATIMDMSTTIFSYGAPEMNIMASAMAQLAHSYNIPFFGMSGCSDAKLPDSQAAVEATFSCLCSSMSGANMVHDNGWLDHATLVSPEYMVLVNEVIEKVNRYMNGMRVDEDRLALDVIDSVGPGGHFLLEEHTMSYFREIWYSKLFDRSTTADWRAAGSKQFHERLREQTLRAMEHEPEPLPAETLQEIEDLAARWTA
jgi:trimethylamine--corrinoid protein Co-methyltransferase